MSFFRKERLFTDVKPAGGTSRETFRQIAPRLGDLNGYLAGVMITVSGNVKESEEASDLHFVDLWKIVQGITLKGLDHEWCVDAPGALISMMNMGDETLDRFKPEIFAVSSLSSSDEDVAFKHTYVLPIAQKAFQPQNRGKGNKDGCFPLASMLEQGELTVNLANTLPGNWGISGNVNVEAHILTYWTEDKTIPAPWRLDWFTDVASDVQFSARQGRVDYLAVMDDEFNTFTLPTNRVKIEADGVVITDELTGDAMNNAVMVQRDRDFGLIAPRTPLHMVAPTDMQSRFDELSCNILRVRDANGSHQGSLLYAVRRNLTLDPARVANYARSLGINPDLARDPAMLTISKRPVGSLATGKDGVGGLPVRVG